jgi:hypothetical protein
MLLVVVLVTEVTPRDLVVGNVNLDAYDPAPYVSTFRANVNRDPAVRKVTRVEREQSTNRLVLLLSRHWRIDPNGRNQIRPASNLFVKGHSIHNEIKKGPLYLRPQAGYRSIGLQKFYGVHIPL